MTGLTVADRNRVTGLTHRECDGRHGEFVAINIGRNCRLNRADSAAKAHRLPTWAAARNRDSLPFVKVLAAVDKTRMSWPGPCGQNPRGGENRREIVGFVYGQRPF